MSLLGRACAALLVAGVASAEPAGPSSAPAAESRFKSPLVVVRAPREGQTFAPGDVVTISLAKAPGVPSVANVEIVTPDLSVLPVPTVPATVRLPIPNDAAGGFELMAVAVDDDGASGTPFVRTIQIVPKAQLLTLEVTPTHVRIPEPGNDQVLSVQGRFDDGVVRDLTQGSTGTTYHPADTSIVSATANGMLRAGRDGKTSVLVRNRNWTALVDVEVGSPTTPP